MRLRPSATRALPTNKTGSWELKSEVWGGVGRHTSRLYTWEAEQELGCPALDFVRHAPYFWEKFTVKGDK